MILYGNDLKVMLVSLSSGIPIQEEEKHTWRQRRKRNLRLISPATILSRLCARLYLTR